MQINNSITIILNNFTIFVKNRYETIMLRSAQTQMNMTWLYHMTIKK